MGHLEVPLPETCFLWDLANAWLAGDEVGHFRIAIIALLKADLKFRTGQWDGKGWPEGC